MRDTGRLRPYDIREDLRRGGAYEQGAGEADPTIAPGELVYAERSLVHTRRWTWRQSENGKTGPDAMSALIPIDGFTDENLDAVLAARDELASLIAEAFGCRVVTGLASAESPRVELAC